MSGNKRTSSEANLNNDIPLSIGIVKKLPMFTTNLPIIGTQNVVDSTTTIVQKPIAKKPIAKKPIHKKPSLAIDKLVSVAVAENKPVAVTQKPVIAVESANIQSNQSSNRAKEPLVENPGLGDIYKQVIKLRLQDHQNLKTLFMMTNTIMNDVKNLKKYTHLLNVDRKHNMTISELMDLCDTLNGESEEIMVSWFVSLFQDRPDSFRDLANLMNDAIATVTSKNSSSSSSSSSTHYDPFSIQNIMGSTSVCNSKNSDSELYFTSD
ncbi:MAG: hypothetical protein WD512_08195 [Candidatus Paceibacterota bacterium]